MATKPKNWSTFQHYKNRRPPWIRLYHTLLDNPDFHALRGEDAKYLMMLWLIASEHENGELPELAELAFRLRLPEKKAQQVVSRLQAWLEKDASTVLARRKQVATPETETEAEAEGEAEVAASAAPPPSPASHDFDADEEQNIPDDLPSAVLGNFLLERLSIPHNFAMAKKFADCAGFIARDEGVRRGEAARVLLERARGQPPDDGKWRFWLEDGAWKKREQQGISTEGWDE